MPFSLERTLELMKDADNYARRFTGCLKVHVGSCLATQEGFVMGCNTVEDDLCKNTGCLREQLYGDDSKSHRLPTDCRATHSEISALGLANRLGMSTAESTLIVTRYPCENCARAIVAAGVRYLYYGRKQEISEMTRAILTAGKVIIVHLPEFEAEDTTR